MSSNTNKTENWNETLTGKTIIAKKYLHEDETTFEEFICRVGFIFSNADLQSDMIQSLEDASFFPAGRSLYGAGSKGKFKCSMSNCYILPMPEDNIESIYDVAKQEARIFSYGGGTGLNISNLRPRGAKVSNSAKTSTGAVSFIPVFSVGADVIGANNRRAALMIGMNCSHPDLEEFLDIKRNNDAVQGANLSILFTDDFMHCVRDNMDYTQQFIVGDESEIITKVINARDFFMKFAEAQWDWAEPGAIFIDNVRRSHLMTAYPPDQYNIDIPNPCAEYYGSANNSCNLGSINLYNIVKNPFTKDACIDWEKFEELIQLGITALDEILDYGYDMQPLEANKKCIDDWRPIGLGVFGLADMFIAMGIKYGSDESSYLAGEIAEFMMTTALETSCHLAQIVGTFGKYNWEYIKQSPFLERHEGSILYNNISKYGLRNGSLLSIAPTGSIGTMAGMSGGIEPLFSITYQRTTHALEKEGKYFRVFSKSVEHLLKHNDINPDTITDEEIMVRFPYITVSHEISPADRIKVQSAMQPYIDNAISSTINMKNDVTVQDVFDTYMNAWESGCKGITTFRNGCKRSAIMKTGKETTPEVITVDKPFKYDSIVPVKIGDVACKKITKHTSCVKNLYVFVCNDGENIVEVFTNIVQGCTSNIATITRQASLELRSGIEVAEVVAELCEHSCKACIDRRNEGKTHISRSCGSAIGEAIMEEYKRLKGKASVELKVPCDDGGCATCKTPCKEITPESKKAEVVTLLPCPKCNMNTLRPEGKCFTCYNCNYSACE